MSEMPKNHCPPKTTAPKMEVHDASEGSKDIKPKVVSTAHKNLSQDEFQRKVAMAARTVGLEKTANPMGAAGAVASTAAKAAPWLSRLWGGTKALATTGVLPSVAKMDKTWRNLPLRALVGEKGLGSYYMHPASLLGQAATVGSSALPYVGGALQRAGQAIGGTVGLGGSQGGMGNVAGGGLIGAGLGGLAGAMMPGEEEYEDEDGRIRKRRGSMLAGALRGAGMGGLAGAGVGAGMDYMGKTSAAHDFGGTLAKQIKS